MKIALLLPGQFRNVAETYPYTKGRILDRYNPDVFISTWNFSDEIKSSLRPETIDLENSLTLEEVKEIFNPKKFVSDSYTDPSIQEKILRANLYLEKTPDTGEINGVSVFSMWYKIWHSLSLMLLYEKESGTKYDYIIKSRFDLKFLNPLPLPKGCSDILIPPGYDWRGGTNDLFAFGTRESMIYYCSLFDSLEKYISEDNVNFHPETLLNHHLTISRFKINRPPIKISLRGINVWEK